uniref:Histidine kinase/HSP90-like ATPase domain-containing protein n=1 Tax=Ditylenchus dipsaci TaxID=166011 RepID=A0A915DLU7_9BILA
MASRAVIFIWVIALLACVALIPRYSAPGKTGKGTDAEVVAREEEAIKIDGLSVSEVKKLREGAEKHEFQAEVNRMMKLIINSLYRNKEIFLRELISNASDALDKIRLLSLTSPEVLNSTPEFSVRIKADKDNHILHITDTGVGMTKQDLINNLEPLLVLEPPNSFPNSWTPPQALRSSKTSSVNSDTKHNDDKQYIWESDSATFTIAEDPRNNLPRGTQISLHLKEEAHNFLEPDTLKKLVHKYSQFINFDIFLWQSKTETVEEAIEEEEVKEKTEDGTVEEAKEDKPRPRVWKRLCGTGRKSTQ